MKTTSILNFARLFLWGLCIFILSGCITRRIDVSKESPFNRIIGQTYRTKVTCKLIRFPEEDYPVARFIAERVSGELQYKIGASIGKENFDYIRDGNVFKVVNVINRKNIEVDYYEIIGYFPSLEITVDVGLLFDCHTGETVTSDDRFIERINP